MSLHYLGNMKTVVFLDTVYIHLRMWLCQYQDSGPLHLIQFHLDKVLDTSLLLDWINKVELYFYPCDAILARHWPLVSVCPSVCPFITS